MKDKILNPVNQFSRAIIQPVMFLPVMGLFIAITVLLKLDMMPSIIATLGGFINTMMNAMLSNLSIIFAVGITAALAKNKKVDAAILSIIVFLMFLAMNNAYLTEMNLLAEPGEVGLYGTGQTITLGYQVIDMGVFLGMILGALTGYIHNKYSNVEFPDMFRIFGGSRLAFMIMIPITLLLGIIVTYIWPPINNAIFSASSFIQGAGALGVFLYAFLNRFLVPTGLHHMLWMPFGYTAIGGTANIGGEVYSGAINIFYGLMANSGSVTQIDPSIRFAVFGFAKVFATIGITLAFLKTAKPENKKKVQGMLLPALLVSIMSGITEPFDFLFLFISPLLWLVHSVLTGVFETILWVLGSKTFMTDGLIQLFTTNLVFKPSITRIYIFLLVGVLAVAVWYFAFTAIIKKLDIKTPGREAMEEEADIIPSADNATILASFIEGLGGRTNIVSLDNCFTRLRIELKDTNLINNEKINQLKNSGIVKKGSIIQVIIGMKVQTVREQVAGYLNME